MRTLAKLGNTILIALLLVGCGAKPVDTVVVYTALDEMYSQPILAAFEQETGIKVHAVYDTEAAKTTGLVTRLIAERERPRADVFWSNEVAQTILLKSKGITTAYVSPSAADIPPKFKDADGHWSGFAARGRVIIYNTGLVDAPPASILDFAKPAWRGKAAVAMPLFGTTATHGAALFAAWGEEKAVAFFKSLRDNDVAFLAGNATVRDAVARGDYAIGLTDTDDANGGVLDGHPVAWSFPDQDGMGTLVIPNTVALIAGAPHSEQGKQLIDFLLRPETEARLAAMRSIQIPLKPSVEAPGDVPVLGDIKTMDVEFDAMAAEIETATDTLRRELAR